MTITVVLRRTAGLGLVLVSLLGLSACQSPDRTDSTDSKDPGGSAGLAQPASPQAHWQLSKAELKAASKTATGRLLRLSGDADSGWLLACPSGETFVLDRTPGDGAEHDAAVTITGRFARNGKLRVLTPESIKPATAAELKAAKSAEPAYEMQGYVMTILTTGESPPELTDAEKTELFKGHFAHIQRQAAAGHLVIAGPFGKTPEIEAGKAPLVYRGIFLYRGLTLAEVQERNQEDPTIRAGVFKPIVVPWFGPASLGY